MVFKDTSTERSSQRAFSLTELLVAIGISSIIFTVTALLMDYNGRSIASLANYAELDQESRYALDLLFQEVRRADSIEEYTANEIVFSTGGGTTNLRYLFTPSTGLFVQFKDGDRTELLSGCTSMNITLYGRNMISNQFSQFATTNVASAKMVQFHWRCERKVLGSMINSENVQSAKIVVRKQN